MQIQKIASALSRSKTGICFNGIIPEKLSALEEQEKILKWFR